MADPRPHLSWFGIVRLGLVQTALGAIIVLTTSTINRVMVVEMALPATLPGALVGWHYALQVLRPRWGFGADKGHRATPWIIGGMATLALGGFLSAVATGLAGANLWAGVALAIVAFTLIGVGVGAAGTSLLVLLAKRVAPERRAPAATIVWLMMIAGFAVTAIIAGRNLDPFSIERLIGVAGVLSLVAFLVATVAVSGVEGPAADAPAVDRGEAQPFRAALAEVWAEPKARLFAIFIVLSMLAYSGQDLILEPFAGAVFGLTPGGSTRMAGIQHGGVLAGMIFVAVAGGILGKGRFGSPPLWTIIGCLASALVLFALAFAPQIGPSFPLIPTVFALGVANGVYAGAAIGSMMALASSGRSEREGTRMGIWGAGQALSFGVGGFLGAAAVDIARKGLGDPAAAYASVFAAEAVLFLISAAIAVKIAGLFAEPRARAAQPSIHFATGREQGA